MWLLPKSRAKTPLVHLVFYYIVRCGFQCDLIFQKIRVLQSCGEHISHCYTYVHMCVYTCKCEWVCVRVCVCVCVCVCMCVEQSNPAVSALGKGLYRARSQISSRCPLFSLQFPSLCLFSPALHFPCFHADDVRCFCLSVCSCVWLCVCPLLFNHSTPPLAMCAHEFIT